MADAPEEEFTRTLLDRRYVTPQQLEEARKEGGDLAEVLVKRGHVTPEQLSAVRGGGRQIGKYVTKRLIAQGGMGTVYEAEDALLRRTVALKILKDTGWSPNLVERLHREAAIVAKLRHPNIVVIHDLGFTPEVNGVSTHFIAMEYIEGGTLAQLLQKGGNDRTELLRILEDLTRAVAYAHACGVIHRDLKPANVLLERTGRVVLTDFGLAQAEAIVGRMTQSNAVMGTPHYMAPEQVEGRLDDVDERTDVYAIGVILYEILTGGVPFEANNQASLFQKILNEDPIRPGSIDRAIKPEIETICLKAMEKTPSRRYRNAAELAEDLSRFRRGEPILARPPSRWFLLRRRIRRNRGAIVAILALLLGVGVTALWAFWIAPSIQKSARRTRLRELEAKTRSALAAEVDRLGTAEPDVVLREARRDAVVARIHGVVASADPEERAVVDRVLESYRAGPQLSRASHARGDWSMAYRFDPSGRYGRLSQLEIARRMIGERRYAEAERILRRLLGSEIARDAAIELAEALLQQGDWAGAAAACARAGVAAPLLEALLRERQSLPIGGRTFGEPFSEPILFLALPRPLIALPWRDGRPAFEIRGGELVPVPSPFAGLPASDRVVDAAAADVDKDGRPEIVAAVERPGKGSGFVVLSDGQVRLEDLSHPVRIVALAVGDLDGDAIPEAVLLFDYQSAVHWLVRFPKGAVEPFSLDLARPWAFAPRIGDFDGDGTPELFVGRHMHLGAMAQMWRLAGGRWNLVDSRIVGEARSVEAMGDGVLAMVVELDPQYVEGKVLDALGSDPQDALVLVRWKAGNFELLPRYEFSAGYPGDTSSFRITAGRIGESDVVAFVSSHSATEPDRRRPEGDRLRILFGGKLHALAVPQGPVRFLDVDGDAQSELLMATGDRLIVRGRRVDPLPELRSEPEPGGIADEPKVLMQVAEDLLGFEAWEAARDILAEIASRFPGTNEGAEAERLRCDALLRVADEDLTASERFRAARKYGDADQRYARAMERCVQAVEEARAASSRLAGNRTMSRRLLLIGAEAARRALDWPTYARMIREAAAVAPGADNVDVPNLEQLARLKEPGLGMGTNPLIADFPARLRRDERGLTAVLDAVSSRHVAGVPVLYPGGALEMEMEFELDGSVFSAGVWLGVVPRVGEPTGPGAVKLGLHGTTRWDLQGANVELCGKRSVKADRYRGRWNLRYSYVPQAGLEALELRSLEDDGIAVQRARAVPEGTLAPGRYVFGFSMGYEGGDALSGNEIHALFAGLRIGRAELRSSCTVEVDGRDLRAVAGARFLAGDRAGAAEAYRRLLVASPADHAARVHLALCGGSSEEFARGFDVDPYEFVIAVDDVMRGASAGDQVVLGAILRTSAARYPGPCLALMGDHEECAAHLAGEDAASRYLRLRMGRGRAPDYDWLAVRSMRTPPFGFPLVLWSPGADDDADRLREGMRRAFSDLDARRGAPLSAWVWASRLLLLVPDDPEALFLRGRLAILLRQHGQAERDWRRRLDAQPKEPSAWLNLASLFALRRATRETLDFLEGAVRAGLPEKKDLRRPEFEFLRDHPRYRRLLDE